ncbi:proton-conducting transporter membrane subunit, partial [Streptomyces sp. JJ36]|uniref:proton-conducting transporter transmembrane domain-containing protein n=1 Tax=Streptomyces sp. JJ36 TaxID=2736645 RepID=UPI001F4028A4
SPRRRRRAGAGRPSCGPPRRRPAVAAGRPAVRAPFLPGGPLALAVDGLAAPVVVTVAAAGALVLAVAAATVRDERPRFFGLMLLFLAAVLVTATATTLPALLLAWEVMGAASYALIAFRWREDAPVTAGGTAFLTTRTGDLGLYLAAGAALAGAAGGGPALSLDALARLPDPWRDLAAAGVLAAALGKAAQLPFSFWLSRAMLGPSPVSALLHSAAMVAMGGYLLLRMRPLLTATGWAPEVAAWAGAVTALLLGAVAVGLTDLKQTLAASTSAQLGFVVLGAGAGAVAGGTAHFVAHAAVKALLFLVAGHWLAVYGTQQLDALRGAARRRPAMGVPFVAGAVTLAGVPPFSLWATKDEVLAATGSTALHAVALAASLLSAVYAGRTAGMVLRRPVRPAPAGDGRPASRGTRLLETVPPAVLAVAGAGLVVLALPPLSGWFAESVGVPGEPPVKVTALVYSGALALVLAAAAAWAAPRFREPGWAREWLGLEAAARAVLVRPTLALARSLARFDDAVLDRAVDAAPGAVRRLASRAAAVDRTGVDGLVRGVAAGTRRLGALARRPQTGQLHHYYAQAVVLLACAAALLLLLLLR